MDPGVAILISDKLDFKVKLVRREWERHYIPIKKNQPRGPCDSKHLYKKQRAFKFITETQLYFKMNI